MSTLTTRPPPWPAYSTNESSPPSTTKCFVLGPLQVPVPLLKSKQIQLEFLPLSLSLSLSLSQTLSSSILNQRKRLQPYYQK